MPAKSKLKPSRSSLTKARILAAALALADSSGVGALSMRKVATDLGVEAMSLYHHVANKDDLLDGMVDLAFSEIELPQPGDPWRDAMRARAASARAALLRHPWAVGLLDSRANPGPATLKHHNAVLGSLRTAGFSVEDAAHAFSLLDSYVYGFVLQEIGLPFKNADEHEAVASRITNSMPVNTYPHLSEMMLHALTPVYVYADEFAFGLELILDGLERIT